VGTGAATGRATTTARSGLDVAASGSESATSQRSKLLLNVVDDSFEGLDGSQRSKLLLNEVDDSFEGLDVSFDIYSVYTVEVKKNLVSTWFTKQNRNKNGHPKIGRMRSLA